MPAVRRVPAARHGLVSALYGRVVFWTDSITMPGAVTDLQQVGRYRVVDLIGEGGFGRFYRALETGPLEREVALKVIKPLLDSRPIIERFNAERQALVLLVHLNIARVLGAGETDDGRPFFAMELVEGLPLNEFCRTGHADLQARLRLFLLFVSAPAHFDIQTGNADKRRRRDLIGFEPFPDAPVMNPVFKFDPNASLAAEADRWRQVYETALAAAQHAPVDINLDVDAVLDFCLVEKRIGYIGGSVDPPSLTPFRIGELPPPFGDPMSSALLLSFEQLAPGSPPEFSPALRLRELLADVHTRIENTGNVARMTALKKIVREIYRVSRALHNASPET